MRLPSPGPWSPVVVTTASAGLSLPCWARSQGSRLDLGSPRGNVTVSLPCARSFTVPPQALASVSGVAGLSQSPSLAGQCRSVPGGAGWWPALPDLLQSPNPVPSESQRRPSTALCCADWSLLEPGVGFGSGLGFSSLGCARWVRREEAVTRAPQGRPEPPPWHPRFRQDCGWVWALAAAAPVQCSRLVGVGPSGRGVWVGVG